MTTKTYRIVPRNTESTYKAQLLRPLNQIVAELEAKEAAEARRTRFEKRPVNSIFWVHMLDMFLFGIAFLSIFGLVIQDCIPDDQFLVWWCIGFTIAIVALVRQQLRFSRFSCRQCGAKLRSEYEIDKPIVFRCEKCRIIWDSGFKHGSD